MAAAGAFALSVLRTGLEPAVRYPGRPDGCFARLPRRAPRLRRRRRARRGRLHGRGLRAAWRPDGEPRGRHRRPAELRQDLALQRAHRVARGDHELRGRAGLGERRHRRGARRADRARSPQAVSAREQVPATVQFSDVAGLVRGSGTRDGGLGGEYLGHLRATRRAGARRALLRRRGGLAPRRPHRSGRRRRGGRLRAAALRPGARRPGAASAPSAPRASARRAPRDELVVLERLAAHLDEGAAGAHARRRGARGPRPAHHQARDLRRQRRPRPASPSASPR